MSESAKFTLVELFYATLIIVIVVTFTYLLDKYTWSIPGSY
jgi:hypothetical protein